jgi:hypothetical protein
MRKSPLLLALTFAFSLFAFAGTITAKQNGSWSTATTWDLNRTPADQDIVIIPEGKTVNLVNTPYSQNNMTARPTLRLDIYGTLDFSNPGNDKLYLDNHSLIQIHATGKIRTNNSNTEIIAIYNGATDNVVWNGTPATLNGYGYATAASSGFKAGVLSAEWAAFHSTCDKDKVQLFWSTAQEVENVKFQIEKSNNGHSWQVAGVVAASSTTTAEKQYAFTDKQPLFPYYRIAAYDQAGKTTYSSVLVVFCSTARIFQVMPTLVQDRTTIHLTAATTSTLTLGLYTQNGLRVQSLFHTVQPGINAYTMDLSGLPQGLYLLQAAFEGTTQTVKVIKAG